MLENQTKKFLLLSDDPADVSFLSELVFMHHAELELVSSLTELCSRIATLKAEQNLVGVAVDVTHKNQLHQFEHLLQTRLGNESASDVARLTYFISGTPTLLNREVLRSPYFSSYLERIRSDFKNSAEFFVASLRAMSDEKDMGLSFDSHTRHDAFEYFKKSYLSQSGSVEWMMGFRSIWDRLIENSFPARFDLSIHYFGKRIRVALKSKAAIEILSVPHDRILSSGVSVISTKDQIVLWIPVVQTTSEASDAFRFMRWINEN